MFSKKHYKALAKLIHYNLTKEEYSYPFNRFLSRLADMLENDNPQFDRDKFFSACDGQK
uniref:Uncharacterized protein n=1 Tax=viral metagenome TaxID=1070528 RepID=A0A6M3LMF4_9ZZZZ